MNYVAAQIKLCTAYINIHTLLRLPINDSLALFDKMVLPILLYGSQIWGHSDCKAVERVHLKFCKRLLGVGSTASDVAVLGEIGRSPLAIHFKMRCIKYWVKLLKLPDQRMPKACYKTLTNLDEDERKIWANDVKLLIQTYGFNFVWM